MGSTGNSETGSNSSQITQFKQFDSPYHLEQQENELSKHALWLGGFFDTSGSMSFRIST